MAVAAVGETLPGESLATSESKELEEIPVNADRTDPSLSAR
jgi:hypothetical protein